MNTYLYTEGYECKVNMNTYIYTEGYECKVNMNTYIYIEGYECKVNMNTYIYIEGYECKVNMNTYIYNSKHLHSFKYMKLPAVRGVQPITISPNFSTSHVHLTRW